MEAAHAKTLRLRLFLEGVEVPVISAQIQCAPNSPSVASIQIPPLAEATRFLPRTTVHLFFLDPYSMPVSLVSAQKAAGSGDGAPSDVEHQQAENGVDNTRWKLLFGGEIVGFTWSKNSGERSVILQCEDWSNYWDYALQAENTDIFGPGLKAVFSGAATNLFTDFLQSNGEVLTQIVCSGKCNTFPKLKGLAAGVIRLMEAVGGSYYVFPDANQKVPPKRLAGQNVFFSYNELRLHLCQMVGTPTQDPTSERIMRYQGYSGMFTRALGGQGGQVSIRQAMNAVSQIIFYEMYPQPCPKYVPGGYNDVNGTKRVRLADHPDFAPFASTATDAMATLQALVNAVNNLDTTSSNYVSSRTGLIQQMGSLRRLLLRAVAQMRNVPEPAPSSMSGTAQLVGQAITKLQNVAAKSFQNVVSAVSSLLSQAASRLQAVVDTNAYIGAGKDRQPAQLFQQVFRPDVWFTAPPRCNVLFPELYSSLSYQRVFLQEPTRLMLKTNDEFFGEDMLFDKLYFAPTAGTVSGERANFQAMLKSKLLMHERFTGILPVFEKMGEFNIFAAREDHRVGINKIGLAQRTANFLYFRHRFNARRMTVSGKFNPYIAVGCPGLVLDRYLPSDAIGRYNQLKAQQNVSQDALTQGLGTNFLGNFQQVTHQVSVQGPVGTTEIQVTFARQPEERIDFLGSIPDDARVQRRVDGDAQRSTNIAAVSAPALYSLGPSNGVIVNVVDITASSRGQQLPLFDVGLRKDSTYAPPTVTVGQQVSGASLGNDAAAKSAGGKNALLFYNAYTITEQIPRYRREQALLPAEEYIRPGWYGDVWTNQKVGETWNELFGIGAITDPQTISDQGRSSSTAVGSTVGGDAVNVDDPKGDAPGAFSLQTGCSIEQAVEFLVMTYSYIKQAGLDVDEFIGAYTWRPIATLTDLFGTSDLAYDASGENVVQGQEGFHSRAFGNYNDLFGLVTPEIETVLNIKRGSPEAKNVDVRKERRQAVELYLSALLSGNALLG